MQITDNKTKPYAPAIAKLLKGVVYDDDSVWDNLNNYRSKIKEYFEVIGVDVSIFDSEGFAFLRQKQFAETTTNDDESEIIPPKLFIKHPLSYSVTLLCVLLLEALYQFDASSRDFPRLIVDKNEIKRMIDIFFLHDETNEAKVIDKLDADINKLIKYGFLKKFNDTQYEVKRILKAKISTDEFLKIKQELKNHKGGWASPPRG